MITTTKQIDDVVGARIVAAGQSVWIDDGIIYSSDDAVVQAIVDAYTLDEAKAALGEKISALAKAKRDLVVAGISAGEMAAWAIKRDEALKYAATGNASDAPLLSIEAAARGVALPVLMAKVSTAATGFAMLEGAIGGAAGKHRDAVTALPDFASLYVYDYATGWPV